MTDDMLHVMEWHNGDKDYSPFSDAEMKRRQDDVRGWMAENDVDAALFTSYPVSYTHLTLPTICSV